MFYDYVERYWFNQYGFLWYSMEFYTGKVTKLKTTYKSYKKTTTGI